MDKKQMLALRWDGEIIFVPMFAIGPVLCAFCWIDYNQKWQYL